MTATTAKTVSTQAPVQIGKAKEAANTDGFASLLADTISKANPSAKASVKGSQNILDIGAQNDVATKQLLGEHVKGKKDIDLSVLGEVEVDKNDPKKNIKLGDLLAELSHTSSAPVGSEVINLKTVLGSKNDDPNLISKDLLSLVPKKDRAAISTSLIDGAKKLLTEQLESRIPKNRVPKTLKGLLETAIRFNIVVSDIKLETLPETPVTKGLLAALELKTDGKAPSPSGKIAFGEPEATKLVADKKSPLEQMLKSAEAKSTDVKSKEVKSTGLKSAEVKSAELKSEEPLAKALQTSIAPQTKVIRSEGKEKERTKSDSKERISEKSALAPKELLAPEMAKVAMNKPIMKNGSGLEQLLSSNSDSAKETQAQESTQSTNSAHAKNDAAMAPLKADNAMNIKMVEGRQLMSQLSADVKEAMENYKPPFTKLSMKLNPERLGEVDVTMIQRGNSVHINLSSNSTVLGILQQNSTDLKEALQNVGLGDAAMNFSSNGENRNQEQQEKHSTSEHYAEMSKLMDDLDELEIVVPRYV